MPAMDESNLELRLKGLGLWLTDAVLERPEPAGKAPPRSEMRWLRLNGERRRRELIDFCTLMTFQTRVGIPLAKALEVACQDCKRPRLSKGSPRLQSHLESGLHFHEALTRYPGVFSTHFVSVVRAGEKSSKLPETFDDLRKYLEWVERVVADIRQATLYPAIVVTVVAGFVLFLFTIIIPKFAELLDKLNVKKPLLTQVILAGADFARHTWWLTSRCSSCWRSACPLPGTSPGALPWDWIASNCACRSSARSTSCWPSPASPITWLCSTAPASPSSKPSTSAGTASSATPSSSGPSPGVEHDIRTGSTISEAMHRHPVFSAMLLRMVTMGEATGKLDQALENVADYYNEIIPRRIKNLFTVLEPALMIFLIFLVGSIALAIYLPIISLMGSIR